MNSLPETLEERIVTCSTKDFLELHDMTPADYFFKRIYSALFHTGSEIPRAYSDLAKKMEAIGAIAITDCQISETTYSAEYKHSTRTIMYGTAIVPRNFVPLAAQEPEPTTGEK